MLPFLTDEVSPELSPELSLSPSPSLELSPSPSQGKTYSRLIHRLQQQVVSVESGEERKER